MKCPDCRGKGWIKDRSPHGCGQVDDCSWCGGSGHVEDMPPEPEPTLQEIDFERQEREERERRMEWALEEIERQYGGRRL